MIIQQLSYSRGILLLQTSSMGKILKWYLVEVYKSGQIIIFHQPRFPWNSRGFPETSATFWGPRSGEVAIIWPEEFWRDSDVPLNSSIVFLHGELSQIPIVPFHCFTNITALKPNSLEFVQQKLVPSETTFWDDILWEDMHPNSFWDVNMCFHLNRFAPDFFKS